MLVEVLRSLTDWLNDGTTGVAAQLAAIPRDGGDPLPTIGTIADETRNNLVAQGRIPSTPGLAVNLQQIPLLDGEVQVVTADGIADVLFKYGVASADTMTAVRDTSYVLRAAIRSLRLYNATTRERNGIAIYTCLKLGLKPVWTPIDDTIVTGAIVGHWQFRDTVT